jgi:hypothetical protein
VFDFAKFLSTAFFLKESGKLIITHILHLQNTFYPSYPFSSFSHLPFSFSPLPSFLSPIPLFVFCYLFLFAICLLFETCYLEFICYLFLLPSSLYLLLISSPIASHFPPGVWYFQNRQPFTVLRSITEIPAAVGELYN